MQFATIFTVTLFIALGASAATPQSNNSTKANNGNANANGCGPRAPADPSCDWWDAYYRTRSPSNTAENNPFNDCSTSDQGKGYWYFYGCSNYDNCNADTRLDPADPDGAGPLLPNCAISTCDYSKWVWPKFDRVCAPTVPKGTHIIFPLINSIAGCESESYRPQNGCSSTLDASCNFDSNWNVILNRYDDRASRLDGTSATIKPFGSSAAPTNIRSFRLQSPYECHMSREANSNAIAAGAGDDTCRAAAGGFYGMVNTNDLALGKYELVFSMHWYRVANSPSSTFGFSMNYTFEVVAPPAKRY